MKGIALSLETVILLILMAIVLAALLSFFLGTFNPAKNKLDVIKQKESLCLQYVSIDPKCDIDNIQSPTSKTNAQSILDKLEKDVCGSSLKNEVCSGTGSCLQACCSSYCPKVEAK